VRRLDDDEGDPWRAHPQTSPARPDELPSSAPTWPAAAVAAAAQLGPYGLPAQLFTRLWSINDVAAFVGVGTTKARELMRAADAPPAMRLRSKRCARWSPLLVIAWLHGDDWTRALPGDVDADGAQSSPPSPVPQLATTAVPDTRRSRGRAAGQVWKPAARRA
jgi:hypothetical protein